MAKAQELLANEVQVSLCNIYSTGDLVGLHKSSSLFKELYNYFLASLFHIDFENQRLAFFFALFSCHGRIRARPTCSLVVTRQFYRKISGNVGACTVSVYQALFSPHEREPGFEATALPSSTALQRLVEEGFSSPTPAASAGVQSLQNTTVVVHHPPCFPCPWLAGPPLGSRLMMSSSVVYGILNASATC